MRASNSIAASCLMRRSTTHKSSRQYTIQNVVIFSVSQTLSLSNETLIKKMKAKAVINEALIVRCLRKKNKSDEEGKNQIVRNIDDVDFATLSELALSYECTYSLSLLSLSTLSLTLSLSLSNILLDSKQPSAR
mgnify:CR=1 FL=1